MAVQLGTHLAERCVSQLQSITPSRVVNKFLLKHANPFVTVPEMLF